MSNFIYIQSESNDRSTNDVLEWIYGLSNDAKVERVNDRTEVVLLSQHIGNDLDYFSITTSDQRIDSRNVSGYWYRRGQYCFNTSIQYNARDANISFKANEHFTKGLRGTLNHIDDELYNRKGVNKFDDNNSNKIKNVTTAKLSGLSIPDSLITNDIDELISFCQKHKKIITKPISENHFNIRISKAEIVLGMNTTVVEIEALLLRKRELNGIVPLPAFYQEYICKKYELRIFFFNGRIYTMAIFSQKNEETKIDSRNIDRKRPPRNVTYQLPWKIETQIRKFMKEADLNSGSIDMIVSPTNDFVFLEVNPIGQYQWVAKNCNFDIDRTIAKYLIS
jgi:ATP-GRASP peptide maturase of grasp-with-spasm system